MTTRTRQSLSRSSEEHRALTTEEKHARKQRVQTHGRASVTRSIADALVIKDGDIFFLTEPNGAVPMGGEHGFGLYYHDCRYLDGYEMKLAGATPEVLIATASRGFMAVIEMTNVDMRMADGRLLPKETLGIRWERIIDSDGLRLCETLSFRNYGQEPAEFPVSFSFESEFEDVFAVRGMFREQLGKIEPPEWKDGALYFKYDGADGVYRQLSVHFDPAPQSTDHTTAHLRIALQPEETRRVRLSFQIAECADRAAAQPAAGPHPDANGVKRSLQASSDRSLAKETEIRSDSVLLNQVIERSLRDLHMLKTEINGQQFFAAGVPWFVTLFGRDSIITALQTLSVAPRVAEETVRLLAGRLG
ncbi:MAG TPA: glycogen debranching N-terminal domain-containing protein, partial [Blastocatellia bacterium]|nr:glycogen debranching N-terminal domain-containing protein [Blastocatellia bacterium]